jgi:hypothetical protein
MILPDLQTARRALEVAVPPAVDVVRSMSDPDVPIPGSAWNTGEAAAHLAMVALRYSELARGVEPTWPLDVADLAASSARNLQAMTQRDGGKLAGMIEGGVRSFLDATATRTGEDTIPWHSGMPLPCTTMTAFLVGEHALHGADLAGALGVPWTIDAGAARQVVLALLPFLPLLVDGQAAGALEACYEMDVDGGPHLLLAFAGGGLSIETVDGRVPDCRLSGDPVPWLLALYGRVPWAELIEDGRVRVAAGDPGLGARFKRLFQNI